MTDLIRLHAPLGLRVETLLGLSSLISPERVAVDLPASEEPPSECAVALHFEQDDPVTLRAAVRGPISGAPALWQRWDVVFTDGQPEATERLIAALSSLRKTAHLRIAADEDVESAHTRAGWDDVRLPHVALPEAHADLDVDLRARLFGKELGAPLMISGMTGGSEEAGLINRRLARIAQELGLALGLGSQRAMIENPALKSTFDVRSEAPDVLLVANLGAVQFNYGVDVDACRRLVEEVDADVLALHLNPLQEMVQPEGDRDWRELLPVIERVVRAVDVPVLAKETGCGISGQLARQLADLGVLGVDVGGTGGTAWGWLEGFRAADEQRQAIGETFREWGIPTADALRSCVAEVGAEMSIVSTGGVRTGLDVARAVALGADVAGMALPFFRAANESEESGLAFGRRILEEIRIAMFCAGVRDVPGLRALEVS